MRTPRFWLGLAAAVALALGAACGPPGVPAGAACSHPEDCVSGATCVASTSGGAAVCATECTPDAGSGCGGGLSCQRVSEVGCCTGCACIAVDVCR